MKKTNLNQQHEKLQGLGSLKSWVHGTQYDLELLTLKRRWSKKFILVRPISQVFINYSRIIHICGISLSSYTHTLLVRVKWISFILCLCYMSRTAWLYYCNLISYSIHVNPRCFIIWYIDVPTYYIMYLLHIMPLYIFFLMICLLGYGLRFYSHSLSHLTCHALLFRILIMTCWSSCISIPYLLSCDRMNMSLTHSLDQIHILQFFMTSMCVYYISCAMKRICDHF